MPDDSPDLSSLIKPSAISSSPEGGIKSLIGKVEGINAAEQADPALSKARKRFSADQDEVDKKYAGIKTPDVPDWNAEQQREKHSTDPIAAFGSAASVFALLASAFTHQPMINALEGSAAAINAIRAGDDKAYNQAYDAWQKNTRLALDRFKMQQSAFEDAQAKLTTDATAMRTYAAQYGDQRAAVLAEAGLYEHLGTLSIARQQLAVSIAAAAPGIEEKNMILRAAKDLVAAKQSGDPDKIKAATEKVRDLQDVGIMKMPAQPRPATPFAAAYQAEQRRRIDEGEPPMTSEEITKMSLGFKDKGPEEEARLAAKDSSQAVDRERRLVLAEMKEADQKAYQAKVLEFRGRGLSDAEARAAAVEKYRARTGAQRDRALNQADARIKETDKYHADVEDLRKRGLNDTEANAAALQRYRDAQLKQRDPGNTKLSPGAIDMLADTYLITGQAPAMGMGGAADREAVYNRADEKAREQGLNAADVVSGRASYKADAGSLSGVQRLADSTAAYENTAELNMKVVEGLMEKGAGTAAGPVINRWIQAGRRATGDPDVKALDAAMQTVANEYAKIQSGSTGSAAPTEGARAEAMAMISSIDTPAAIHKVFDGVMRPDMENKKKAYSAQSDEIKKRIRRGDAGSASGKKYSAGEVIERSGKRYRVTGGDPFDPDVEEIGQ